MAQKPDAISSLAASRCSMLCVFSESLTFKGFARMMAYFWAVKTPGRAIAQGFHSRKKISC